MTLYLLFLRKHHGSDEAEAPGMLTTLAQMLADRDAVIAWDCGDHEAAAPQLPAETTLRSAGAVRPDCIVIDADSYTVEGLCPTVKMMRRSWETVPIIICGTSVHNDLLGRTGADALYCGQDLASFLHLLGTFGFRARTKRRQGAS